MIQHIFLLADNCTKQGYLPNLYEGIQDPQSCEVQVRTISDIFKLAANAIQILIIAAGFVAVGFILYGAILYIISGGDSANIKKGKDTIVNAVVGLIITMLAFAVVRFISGSFK